MLPFSPTNLALNWWIVATSNGISWAKQEREQLWRAWFTDFTSIETIPKPRILSRRRGDVALDAYSGSHFVEFFLVPWPPE